MNELALFAGAGGGILGGHLLGWRTVCGVERDAFAAAVLAQRQNDRCLAPFPVWSDVQSFDGRRWRGIARIVSGGFPCTDISVAGNGEGLDGDESRLWFHMARIIGEVGPDHALVENSPALTTRGGVRVIADLAALGFDCRWGIVAAADAIWLAGYPCLDHLRERIWIAATRADANSRRREEQWLDKLGRVEGARGGFTYGLREDGKQHHAAACADASGERLQFSGGESHATGIAMPERGDQGETKTHTDPDRAGFEQQRRGESDGAQHEAAECGSWWAAEPDVGRMAYGVANRVDRLKCTGNGQVPAVVRLAWQILSPKTEQADRNNPKETSL